MKPDTRRAREMSPEPAIVFSCHRAARSSSLVQFIRPLPFLQLFKVHKHMTSASASRSPGHRLAMRIASHSFLPPYHYVSGVAGRRSQDQRMRVNELDDVLVRP